MEKEQQDQNEEKSKHIPEQQNEDFEIFILEKINQPTLQHDQ